MDLNEAEVFLKKVNSGEYGASFLDCLINSIISPECRIPKNELVGRIKKELPAYIEELKTKKR